MAFVLDCSVTMAWVFPDEATEETGLLRDSLLAGRAVVPAIWPIEVGNVLRVATARSRIRPEDWARIRTNLEALPIEIDPVSASRVWGSVLELAHERRLSVYDAMYLELAVRMRLPLATLDGALAAAGSAVGAEVPTLG